MSKAPPEVEIPPFEGTSGNDTIEDSNGHDWVLKYYGYGGNDTFIAHATDQPYNYYSPKNFWTDWFYGGSGIDTVTYFLSEKPVMANLGTGVAHRMHNGQIQSTDYLDSIENLTGSAYADTIYGSDGANVLRGFGGADTIYGLGGNDSIYGDSGNDTLHGGDGNDKIWGGTGNDTLNGDAGNDELRGEDGEDVLNGGAGNDKLWGGAHDDVLNGGSGNDQLWGGDGDDELNGGSGNDRLEGGAGDDTLDGGTGTDTAVYTGNGAVTVDLGNGFAFGAMGNDTLISIERVETGGGDDVVFGSNGSNRILTGAGDDIVYALGGNDWIETGSGDDVVYGYSGTNTIFGGSGHDELWGGTGADFIDGGTGNDRIFGGAGDDELWGGSGNDLIRGGAGDDTIVTGTGADIVRWEHGDSGYDTITDFNLTLDRFSFKAGFFAVEPVGAVDLDDVLWVFDQGAHAVIAANTAASGWVELALLRNVDAAALGQMIHNESILAAQVGDVGGGGPGGFDFG